MNLKVAGEWDILLCTFRVQLIRSTACECLLMRSPVNVIFMETCSLRTSPRQHSSTLIL